MWVSPAGFSSTPWQVPAGSMERFDEDPLVLALEAFHFASELVTEPGEAQVDVVQGVSPVDLGLASAERVEVRAMKDQDAWHRVSDRPRRRV